MIDGIPIYENANMVIDGEPYEVRRTWRERLLSRPWRPWRATRWVTPKIPDPRVLAGPNNRWFMAHPMVADRIRKEMRRSFYT